MKISENGEANEENKDSKNIEEKKDNDNKDNKIEIKKESKGIFDDFVEVSKDDF